MNQLDASYKRVLSSASNAPGNVMMNTRKLLLLHSYNRINNLGFRGLCNALGLTEDDAYDAIYHLRAVMKIPELDKADDPLTYHHESFGDFLHDFKRSGFSHNFHAEGYQLGICTSARIIEEVCDDGIAGDEDTCVDSRGLMKGHCDNISLSWPGDKRFRRTDEEIRIMLYRNAMEHACAMFFAYDDLQKSISCFHALTTRFTIPRKGFPFYQLRDCAFDRFCHELSSLGKLKQVPLWTFDYGAVCGDVELRFTTPISGSIEVSDPWNMSCQHPKNGVSVSEDRKGWSTSFKRYHQIGTGTEEDEDTDIPRFHLATRQQPHEKWVQRDTEFPRAAACIHCSRRLARLFVNNPDRLATVFVDATQMSYVEVTFVDPADGVSEWRYRFLHSGSPTSIDA